jgi:hypothetical protein
LLENDCLRFNKTRIIIKNASIAPEFTQPPIKWVPGALSPGREANYSPPTSTDVKNTWMYTSTPQYVFIDIDIIYLTAIGF